MKDNFDLDMLNRTIEFTETEKSTRSGIRQMYTETRNLMDNLDPRDPLYQLKRSQAKLDRDSSISKSLADLEAYKQKKLSW